MEKVFLPIVQNLNFFNEKFNILSRRDLLEIIMNMKYQFREAGETVFNQGEFGKEYFIIMKGMVQVSVTNESNLNMNSVVEETALADAKID